MSEKQDSELNDIIEGFKLFGSETDGKINPKEFKEIMDIMNMNEKYPFLYKIISNLCANEEIKQKGGLEADDFISILDQELDDISTFEGLQKIFEIFSDMNTNKISLPVISQILNKDINLEIGEDEEKIKKLFSKPEISGKNIDFDEFNYLMKNDKEKSDIISNNKMYNINYNHQKIKDYENNESNSEKENKFDKNNSQNNIENENDINNNDIRINEEKNIFYSKIQNDVNNFDNVNQGYSLNKINEEKNKSKRYFPYKYKSFENRKQEEYQNGENDINYQDIHLTNNKVNKNKENDEIIKNDLEFNNKDKTDEKIEKRYHRRYRNIKSSPQKKKEGNESNIQENNKEEKNNNNKISSNRWRYRGKK